MISLILSHTRHALAAMLLFVAGALCSRIVLRTRVTALLLFPKWLAHRLEKMIAKKPPIINLSLFIFSFNGIAMMLYLLAGLIPGMPPLIAFMTGLNVAITSLLARERADHQKHHFGKLSHIGKVCAALTFLLELPSFWYTVGMGWSMKITLVDLWRGERLVDLQQKVAAYVVIILPVLALSAVAEAYAVSSSVASMEAQGCQS